MLEKKNKCLKCNSVFGVWGKKPGKYGGFVDCCPTCGNTVMSSIQKNFGFGWTKLRIGIVGGIVSIIGFVLCLYIAYAYFGLALISTGLIISLFAILVKSD
jgi:hypothetical protein